MPNSQNNQQPIHDSLFVESLKTIGLSLVLAFGIRTSVAQSFFVPSGSMEPTIQIDDRLLVDKVSYHFKQPQRGDIVVFSPTDTLRQQNFHDAFVKRVVGLPGEKVEFKGGKVYVNNQLLRETYVVADQQTVVDRCGPAAQAYLSGPVTVPPRSYLVLGDNRENSYDGRCWGFVPRDRMIGRVVVRFWPLERAGTIPESQKQ